MPQTRPEGSNLMNIKLEGDRAYYCPGDTIVGYVARSALTVYPHACVSIALLGRTKSRMVVSRGNSSSTYRGRFNLMNEKNTTQIIFQGPIHIPQHESMRFPFAVTIPEKADPSQVRLGEPQKDTFLPIDPDSVAGHGLPPSFDGSYTGFSTNMDAFVEYWLRARITAGSETREAILPITVRALSNEPPIVDFKLRKNVSPRSIISQRLMPGMEMAELTFSQKTRKFFASSKLPNFTFQLQVGVPSVIQLESPEAIPFRLRVCPDWARTSEELQDIPQKVRLSTVSIKIRDVTRIKCEGTFSNHEESNDSKTELGIQSALEARGREPIYIPCSESLPGLDIGELINLRVGYQGRMHGSQQKLSPAVRSERLHPTFKTYNISHTHTIKWMVRYSIASEVLESSGAQAITILPPSDSRPQVPNDGPSSSAMPAEDQGPSSDAWIVPPTEVDAPPTFEEVEQQDRDNAAKAADAAEGGEKAALKKRDEEEEEKENQQNVAGPSMT